MIRQGIQYAISYCASTARILSHPPDSSLFLMSRILCPLCLPFPLCLPLPLSLPFPPFPTCPGCPSFSSGTATYTSDASLSSCGFTTCIPPK
ncbi:MAG TPA: hypothetical protein DCZ91_05630 [Lachnospiraceae bacterium]|nr:hypothetical protein [Lachnospiraceae bacterium]